MRRVVFAARAKRDLDQIWEHIAIHNLDAAERIVGEVEQAAGTLAEFPGMGHTRADVRDPRFRFWLVRPYVMAYRFTSKTLTVVRIVHGARDFRRIF